MAIETNLRKAITLNADIVDATEGRNQAVVSLSANISNDRMSNVSQSIVDKGIYDANKAEIRKQIMAFQEEVWATEDSMVKEAEAETETEAPAEPTHEEAATEGEPTA